jgi:DNA-binding transcriptional LysR family regulator
MDGIARQWDRLIGERVRLRELRILHAVVRSGSMAKAASTLAMTQPAVSQAIALLEAALGVPLLQRSPGGVTPTEFGEAMLRRALEAMDVLSEGIREVAALADPAGGEVTVGASESYIAGGVLSRTICALNRLYPRMTDAHCTMSARWGAGRARAGSHRWQGRYPAFMLLPSARQLAPAGANNGRPSRFRFRAAHQSQA